MHFVSSALATTRIASLAGLFVLASGCSGTTGSTTPTTDAGGVSPPVLDASTQAITNEFDLRSDMRRLWYEHVAWTRIYLIDAIAGLPETSLTAERLLANQSAIGDAVRPLYGDAAATQLTALLKTHILGAAAVVTAAKAGDQAALAAANTAWYANADQIAKFLADANPHWTLAALTNHMHTHLDRTLVEAKARLTGDWAGDVTAYDAVEDHILTFSDFLTNGLVQQFPDKIAPSPIAGADEALQVSMRRLWEEHVLWTRVWLVDQTSNLPDTSFAANRLLQNQVDIGNALKPYYGAAAGDALASLLHDHITGAVALVLAYESGNQQDINYWYTAWYANGDQIARSLAALNPYWPLADSQNHMKRHLDLTVDEVSARLQHAYPGDITSYDAVVAHILTFSDFLADGIALQFTLVK